MAPDHARAQLIATAYHEAGHAVAAYMLGRAFTRVSICADDSTTGRCSFRPPGEWFRPEVKVDGPIRRRLEERIMISLAGPESEAMHTGTYDTHAAREDLERAIDHACFVTGDEEEASAYVEWLRLRTLNLMRHEHFGPALEALAGDLLEQVEVRYRRAKRVIEQALVALPATPAASPATWAARLRPDTTLEAVRRGRA